MLSCTHRGWSTFNVSDTNITDRLVRDSGHLVGLYCGVVHYACESMQSATTLNRAIIYMTAAMGYDVMLSLSLLGIKLIASRMSVSQGTHDADPPRASDIRTNLRTRCGLCLTHLRSLACAELW